MKTLRLGLTITALVLLAGGYAASQFAVWGFLGGPEGWAERVNRAPLAFLSLALVVAAAALALAPDGEEEA